VVVLAREKRAITNYYEEQKKIIITGRNYEFVPIAPVLLVAAFCFKCSKHF
jgi:hypothetical protein